MADTSSPRRGRVFGQNPNVFFLGLVSLLTDISSEMIFTLVPLFLANVLGAATTVIGFIGGLSESTDAVFRIISGWYSDRIGRRKPFAVMGYGLSTLIKPFMYLASSWGGVAAIRFTDRLGKGFRSFPRDALLADSISSEKRGRSFGLQGDGYRRCVPLLAVAAVIIYYTEGGAMELGLETYRWLVLVGTIPPVLSVLVLLFFVKEGKQQKTAAGSTQIQKKTGWRGAFSGFDMRFRLFLLVMAVFTLGNSSDFFVILRAQNLEAPLVQVTLMLVLFNITYAAVSGGRAFGTREAQAIASLGGVCLVYRVLPVAAACGRYVLFAAYGHILWGGGGGSQASWRLVARRKEGHRLRIVHGVVG
jgi:hypothetical protein